MVGIAVQSWVSTCVEEGYRHTSGTRQNRPQRQKDYLNVPRTDKEGRQYIADREYMHMNLASFSREYDIGVLIHFPVAPNSLPILRSHEYSSFCDSLRINYCDFLSLFPGAGFGVCHNQEEQNTRNPALTLIYPA